MNNQVSGTYWNNLSKMIFLIKQTCYLTMSLYMRVATSFVCSSIIFCFSALFSGPVKPHTNSCAGVKIDFTDISRDLAIQ